MAASPTKPMFLPYFFIVGPVLVSLSLAFFGWRLLDEAQRLQGIWTLCSLILGGIVTVLLRHYELHKTTTELKAAQEASIQANQRMMRIEKGIKEEESFQRLASLNDAMGLISDTKLSHPMLSDLISWRSARIFQKALEDHTALAEGIIYIDDANKELNSNETLLRQLPTSTVRAVSFEDEGFWTSPEGTSMLTAHKHILDQKKVRTRRLFIIESDMSFYKEMLARQIKHGIEVRCVRRDKIRDLRMEDFVLYDDLFLRTGYKPGSQSIGSLSKFAHVTWKRQSIEEYSDAFEALWLRASSVDGNVT